MFDHFIYDFDGTISDTYPVATKVLVEMVAEQGKYVDDKTAYADLKISHGYATRKYGLPAGTFTRRTVAAAKQYQQPFPEAAGLLHAASLAGKKNYIYTHSGKEVEELLRKWGMFDDVTFILDNTTHFPRKPDPSALLFLMEKFSIDRKKVLMVGDRDIDIEAAHNAGIAGCLFDCGKYYPECQAEYHIENLSEILKFY